MKDNFKNYKFWLALIASVIVLINTLGAVFHFSVNEVAITSIATAVLGIFVALGVINKNTKDDDEITGVIITNSENTDTKNQTENPEQTINQEQEKNQDENKKQTKNQNKEQNKN